MSGLARADGSGTGAPAPGPTSRPSNNTIVPYTIGGQGQTPAYTVVRWNENYTFLRDAAKRDDFFDAIKYIPLTQDGKTYLSLGGEVRERYELFNNANFGPPTPAQDHDGYWLTRLLAYGDLHIGDNIRFFGEVKTALIDERLGGSRATDSDEFDFDQGFGDFKLPFNPNDSLTLRVGRQYLLYGAQRLISPLDWVNTRRTFDGVKLMLNTPGPADAPFHNSLDAFVVKPVVIDIEHENPEDDHSIFWGLYDTLALPTLFSKAAHSDVELYFLGLDQTSRPAFNQAAAIARGQDTFTIGTRFYTNPKPFDVDTEADYQFGRAGDAGGNISAYSYSIEAGYTAPVDLSPRFDLGFDIASGDRNAANPDKNTFNQLFPLGHAYFGYTDVIGRQNIIDAHTGLTLNLVHDQPLAKLISLRGEFHEFWRESSADSVYNAAGGVQRAAVAGVGAKYIGNEIDLLLNWQVDRHLSAYSGYSHFFAGTFLHDTGPSNGIDFFYLAVNYAF